MTGNAGAPVGTERSEESVIVGANISARIDHAAGALGVIVVFGAGKKSTLIGVPPDPAGAIGIATGLSDQKHSGCEHTSGKQEPSHRLNTCLVEDDKRCL